MIKAKIRRKRERERKLVSHFIFLSSKMIILKTNTPSQWKEREREKKTIEENFFVS